MACVRGRPPACVTSTSAPPARPCLARFLEDELSRRYREAAPATLALLQVGPSALGDGAGGAGAGEILGGAVDAASKRARQLARMGKGGGG